MTPRVHLIIAAHNPARPVARAVTSVVMGNPEALAVVVCHNTSIASIRETIAPEVAERARFLQLDDGIPAPSGPFNHGIGESDAEFVSIMGSDDLLDPGAVANWLEAADRWQADAVIARIVRGEQRSLVRSPALRPWHRGSLDIVRDRLPYRSAPLGLVRRDAVDRLGLLLTPEARSGGDLEFVSRLWAGGRVVYADGPGYVEMPDATDRVTHVMKPVSEELHWAADLLGSAWFISRPERERRAIAAKLVRRNLLDTVLKRRDLEEWAPADVADLRDIAGRMLHAAPGVWNLLAAREQALLRAIHGSRWAEFGSLVSLAKVYRHPAALLGPHPWSWTHPAGSLRFAIAAALMR